MKTTKKILMAVLAISLAACSGGGKLKPASKKVNGQLGKFFEVVERDYKINGNELSVEFKRIAVGGPTGASWSSEPTFMVEIQDEDGNSVASEHTNVVFNKEQLESVFSLGVNETASITLRFNEDKIKDAVKFKVSSKWNEGEEKSNSNGSNDRTFDLKGSVGEYAVTMHIEIDDTDVNGNYYYDNLGGPNRRLKITGKVKDDGSLDLNETNSNGMPTGHFIGRIVDDVFSGEFVNYKAERFSFSLYKTDAVSNGNHDLDDADYDISIGDEGDSSFDSEGDSSFDELLDEYEKYYRTLISFGKKMHNNDPTAMVEYAKLLKRAKDYSEKIEKVKGKLSPSQLNRFNKINIEMAEEMQKIQSR